MVERWWKTWCGDSGWMSKGGGGGGESGIARDGEFEAMIDHVG